MDSRVFIRKPLTILAHLVKEEVRQEAEQLVVITVVLELLELLELVETVVRLLVIS